MDDKPVARKTTQTQIRVDVKRQTLSGWKAALEALEASLGREADGREIIHAHNDGYGKEYFLAWTNR